MVTWRASSNMVRGTKLPANRRAAEIRGSTTARSNGVALVYWLQ